MAEVRSAAPTKILKETNLDQKLDQTVPKDATTTQARQAIAPHRLRYMLTVGIVAVVVGFVIVYFLRL